MDENETNISGGSVWCVAGSNETLIDRCFSVHVLVSLNVLQNSKYFTITQNLVALFWFIDCDTQNIRLKTLQTAISYMVYR